MKFDANKHSAKVMNHLLFVIQNNHRFNTPSPSSSEALNDFRLEVIRLARKQQNYNLSAKHLVNTLQIVNSFKTQPLKSLADNVKQYMDTVKTQIKPVQMELEYESAKLLYSMDRESNKYNALQILLRSSSTYIDQLQQQSVQSRLSVNIKMNEICSKSILYVCNIFNSHPTLLNEILACKDDNASLVNASLDILLSLKNVYNIQLNFSGDFAHGYEHGGDKELLIGDLLDLSTVVCKNLGKPWYALANWCYKQGM